MYFSIRILTLFVAAAHPLLAAALPLDEQVSCKCSEPRIRKEWRTLSNSEQDAYINAIQCLKDAPSKGTKFYEDLRNRYDDFVASHINATRASLYGVHSVGVFLPWHRYAIWTFESALRSECNYTGAQPYWDWTLDGPASNRSLLASPVLQAFGGNGSATTGCVEDGPFTGGTFLNIGPGDSMSKNPRCLSRAISDDEFNTSSNWDDVFQPLSEMKKYTQVQRFIDGLDFFPPEDEIGTGATTHSHSLMHMVIGGDFMDVLSSPNDPLFWLHHSLLDYMWTLWQQRDKARLTDIGGARTLEGYGPSGDKVENTTLATPLWMGFLNEDVPVKKVLDTMNRDGEGILCYKYEDSPSIMGRTIF
ncbi:hypothetical protein B0J12DRAFT_635931 [Macrophomina phaseolina]|uniref:Tyrosinase copper-binding domain-containing protein n=1 Tax=Macrophomina phaseolina TaxID=35725 RepID=A0ABQ8FQW3_9PEZI|nr:hypothetical protein B0J12DRAFT_635931 [Macrophomina phaseolina]